VRDIAPELVCITVGLVLLAGGLVVWFGYDRAAVVVGALLLALGSWSAATTRADRGR
jgi:membrane protein implicated in regulation of membrane protease activity